MQSFFCSNAKKVQIGKHAHREAHEQRVNCGQIKRYLSDFFNIDFSFNFKIHSRFVELICIQTEGQKDQRHPKTTDHIQ